MPAIFTLISRFSDEDLRSLPGGTLPVLHRAAQMEAERRLPGSSATLLGISMSDQFAPRFDGVVILSRWQQRAPIAPSNEAPTDA